MARRQLVEPAPETQERLGRDPAPAAHRVGAPSSFRPGAFTVPSPLTYMYSVVVVIPSRRARSCAFVSRAAIALIAICSMARSILRGRPPWRPLARAAARPAGAFGNELALEFGQRGENRED